MAVHREGRDTPGAGAPPRNLLNGLREQLEAEGISVASTNTNPSPPIIIEPVKERRKYDIAIPIAKPCLTYDRRKLLNLDVRLFEPMFEIDERFRIKPTPEFAAAETETRQCNSANGLRRTEELLPAIANLVVAKAELPDRFAELYPVIRGYIGNRCFGRKIELDDNNLRSHLARPEIKESIAKYLARKIAELTIKRRGVEFEKQDFKLFETKPFGWRRNLPPLEAEKTVFNFVAACNDFEREFAEFLDNAGDILRFAALGTTEQGASGASLRVDYLKPSGAIGLYCPGWVAVQRELDGEIINWAIETKGRVGEGIDEKDAAMWEWCRRVGTVRGDEWKYFRVNQFDFQPGYATFRKLLVTLVGKDMIRKRDASGATLSHEEFVRFRDEGRA